VNRRLQLVLPALVVLAVAAALASFLFRPATVPPPEVVDADPVLAPAAPQKTVPVDPGGPSRGGSYDGRVVDPDGNPVADADVMLVAQGGSRRVPIEGLTDASGGEPLEVPVFDAFETAARTRTDARGGFRLTAGDARVRALFAYAKGFTPTFKAHTSETPLVPGRDHEIRLQRPGWLEGHVVDAATQEGIPNAQVTVYLQGKSNQETPGPEAFGPGNQFGAFQSWLAREAGELVWGLKPTGFDLGLTFPTQADGKFSFGPLTSEAQVEVVVTHPDYMWTEFDPTVRFAKPDGQKPDERVRRTVVPAGETVRRTYALEKGREVNGRVLDRATSKPIEGVEISLEHVSQYKQHYWYRVRARTGRTDADGRFRLAGLSYPPYVLRMEHPAFDSEFFHGVKDGPQVTPYLLEVGGWIEGTVAGDSQGKSFLADVHLQPTADRGPLRRARLRVEGGAFAVEKVKPGTYSMWMVSGDLVSPPVPVTVEGDRGTKAEVSLSRGGGFALEVRDASGAAVDPVSVELEVLAADGGARRAATLVARAGRAQATGLLPGRYRAVARATGFAPATTEPFDVPPEGFVAVPPLTLARRSWLQIVGVRDAEGRSVAGVDLAITVSQDGGPAVRVKPLDLGRIPVAAGKVTVVVVAPDGRRFEQTYDVEEGKSVSVEIVLSR
jgi:5-hydroxyisourate hydrolase-like protein (transthyretin family)